MSDRKIGVLFVCHANMCRSPLAEGIFREEVRRRGLQDRFVVDSAGTWAGEGHPPHPLSCEVARAHGFELGSRGRPVRPEDLDRFDQILVMDRRNLADMERYGDLAGPRRGRARVRLLRTVLDAQARGRELDVPDPVAGGPADYARTYELLEQCCRALANELVDGGGRTNRRDTVDG